MPKYNLPSGRASVMSADDETVFKLPLLKTDVEEALREALLECAAMQKAIDNATVDK